MIKVLHSCDLNLGAEMLYPQAVCDRLSQAQLSVLDTILDLATEHGVDLLVFTGNLFAHHAPEEALREAVIHRFKALPAAIRLVVLAGCYDQPLGPDSIYHHADFSPWFVDSARANGSPLNVKDGHCPVWLYTLPWQCDAGDGALGFMQRNREKGIHLGAFHSHKLKHRPNPYQDPLAHWTKAITSWQLDYVMVGNRRAGQLSNDDGQPIADCPGAPQGLSFQEPAQRYCSLVELGEAQTTCQALPCQHLRFEQCNLVLDGHGAEEKLHKILSEKASDELALQLKLHGDIEELFDVEAIAQRHRDEFVFLTMVDETHFLNSDYMTQMAQEETVRGILCRRLVEMAVDAGENQRAVYERAVRELLHRFHAVAGEAE
ncbi:MAG: hypothetical protein C0620_03420 [Desulfuromonas sp.]|nr:MAG: hypothetical protein C0620_03420 [Desulfuromonas sp.]